MTTTGNNKRPEVPRNQYQGRPIASGDPTDPTGGNTSQGSEESEVKIREVNSVTVSSAPTFSRNQATNSQSMTSANGDSEPNAERVTSSSVIPNHLQHGIPSGQHDQVGQQSHAVYLGQGVHQDQPYLPYGSNPMFDPQQNTQAATNPFPQYNPHYPHGAHYQHNPHYQYNAHYQQIHHLADQLYPLYQSVYGYDDDGSNQFYAQQNAEALINALDNLYSGPATNQRGLQDEHPKAKALFKG